MKKIIIFCFLLVMSSAQGKSLCQEVNKEGFYTSNGMLCFNGLNYTGVMSEKNGFEINSFDIIDNNFIIFSAYNKIGYSLFLANDGGYFQILRERTDDAPEKNLEAFRSVRYDKKNGYIYFISRAWATSGAIHKIKMSHVFNSLKSDRVIRESDVEFVSSGNSLFVVDYGGAAGSLIVNKHKYKNEGGSYDSYFLVSPDGKELSNIGPSDSDVKKFFYNNK